MRVRDDGYEIDTDPDRLDTGRVRHWISTDAYWARGRPADLIDRSLTGSLCYGMYAPGGDQVAFARAVTDRATFAWLCDVYVDRSVRGRGLGTWLVGTVIDDLQGFGVPRILLATKDAHGVYARFGFVPLADPATWMELDKRGQGQESAATSPVRRTTMDR